jgi:hypothetical protein
VALDQRRLEQQRLAHGVDDGVLDVRNTVHRRLDAQRLRRPALLPVLPYAVAQVLRLADVEHRAADVLEQVHAGLRRELGQGGLELRCHPRSIVAPDREAAPPFDGTALLGLG